jgi:hypothetical protein
MPHTVLPPEGRQGPVPELPERQGGWLPSTREWWERIWRSPVATQWIDADFDAIHRLALFPRLVAKAEWCFDARFGYSRARSVSILPRGLASGGGSSQRQRRNASGDRASPVSEPVSGAAAADACLAVEATCENRRREASPSLGATARRAR